MIHNESRILIKAEMLGKEYKLGNELMHAVKDVELSIRQGEFVIIQGLCGKQKNVFFNLIGCLEKPTSGKYYFDYEDVALAGTEVLDGIRKLKLGYLFRNYNLVGRLTAAQNVGLPAQGLDISGEEKRERALKAMKYFGIETVSEEISGNLRDYQKQLVSLARAIVNNPLMILADEPSENLDGEEEQELIRHLFKLNSEGIAIVLITDRPAMKSLSGCRLITFENGRICSDKEEHKLSLVRREA